MNRLVSKLTQYFLVAGLLCPAGMVANMAESYRAMGQAWFSPEDMQQLQHALQSPKSNNDVLTPNFTPPLKRATVLNLFASAEKGQLSSLIEPKAFQDLELFRTLFPHIDRTTTIFGQVALARRLATQATTDITTLQQRQQVVQSLLDNEPLLNSLEKTLDTIKGAESSLLVFFLSDASFRQRVLSAFNFYYDDRLEQISKLSQIPNINESPNMLSIKNFHDKASLAMAVMASFWAVQNLWHVSGRPKFSMPMNASIFTKIGIMGLAAGAWLRFGWNVDNLLQTVVSLPMQHLGFIKHVKDTYKIHVGLQRDLMNLAQTMSGLRTILSQECMKNIPECQQSLAIFKKSSDSMEKLRSLLNTSTFKGKPSFFSHFGRVLAANRLMSRPEVKAEFVSLFKAIGELDVYVSTAKLLKEHRGSPITYSLATFERADHPRIALQTFWNPLVDEKKVIANDLTCGGNDPRALVITGANTCGKSTVIRAVALNVLLAQTLGIVPAAAATLTPFTCINTVMHIPDNVQKEASGLVAEGMYLKEQLAKINAHKPNEFSLTIFDDQLMGGTSPDQTEELVVEYTKGFARPNAICMIACHREKPTRLEQELLENGKQIFANYKVDMDELPDGVLKRNFKLKRGVCNQKFARKILQQMGALPAVAG